MIVTWLIRITWFCLAILAYHSVGYPLFLWLLSRLKPRANAARPINPSVSLIIAAYNEAGVIAEKIENSLALDYAELEIIVVSDGSDDETPQIADRFSHREVISMHQSARRGKAHAINRAAARARGDILLFSDANAFYLANSVTQLIQHFADPEVGCVTGKKTVRAGTNAHLPAAGEGFYWRYESMIKKLESQLDSTAGVVGEIIAVRRAIFQPIPNGVINDDVYLGLLTQRSGYRVVYEPDAISWERPSLSMQDDIVRRRRMTAGRFQALFQPSWWPWNRPTGLFFLWSHKFLRLLLPFFMLSALGANLALIPFAGMTPLLWLILSAQLAFYAMGLVGLWAARRGRRWRLPAIIFYVIHGNLATLQGLWRYLNGQQSILWQKAKR